MEKIIKLCDIEIQKQKFHEHKEPISVKNIDVNKIVVSNKVSFGKRGFKYFIGYWFDDNHQNNSPIMIDQ